MTIFDRLRWRKNRSLCKIELRARKAWRTAKRTARNKCEWRATADKGEYLNRLSHKMLGNLNEFVVGEWLHLEQLDTNLWYLKLGQDTFSVQVSRFGKATIVITDPCRFVERVSDR